MPQQLMMIHREWNREALADYLLHARVADAWSNIVLGAMILLMAVLSIRHDRRRLNKPISAMSLFFVSIFVVNLVAALSHMIEHYEPIASGLRLDLDFINHSAIGLCALWVEVSMLERVRALQQDGWLKRFPRKTFVGLVVSTCIVFQVVNWSIRSEPNFQFAILDYMLSLMTLFLFCAYVVAKLPAKLDRRYEAYSIASFFILAGASIAHVAFQGALPVGEAVFNVNDLYHLLAAPAFVTLFKAKCFAGMTSLAGMNRSARAIQPVMPRCLPPSGCR